jgi:hypothetical protein
MTIMIRRALGATLLLSIASVLAGCGSSRLAAPTEDAAVTAPATIQSAPISSGVPDAALLIARLKGRTAHPYFPIVPGAYSDYRVTLFNTGTRYIRVTAGAPTLFFDRMATPFVYSEIPGMVPDTILVGLRQYFSISPEGALWFHGAENGIVRAHSDPPVRQLIADPRAGESWADTVVFESFIGPTVFIRDRYLYTWTLSETARLPLPAGTFRALRATSLVDSAPPEPGAMAMVRVLAGTDADDAFAGLGVALKPQPVENKRGSWFAKHVGIVARDWPSGLGPSNINTETFELMGRGVGPVPPPLPPPPPPGT